LKRHEGPVLRMRLPKKPKAKGNGVGSARVLRQRPQWHRTGEAQVEGDDITLELWGAPVARMI